MDKINIYDIAYYILTPAYEAISKREMDFQLYWVKKALASIPEEISNLLKSHSMWFNNITESIRLSAIDDDFAETYGDLYVKVSSISDTRLISNCADNIFELETDAIEFLHAFETLESFSNQRNHVSGTIRPALLEELYKLETYENILIEFPYVAKYVKADILPSDQPKSKITEIKEQLSAIINNI